MLFGTKGRSKTSTTLYTPMTQGENNGKEAIPTHGCQAIVIHCGDHRLQRNPVHGIFHDALEEHFPNGFDLELNPGGVKTIVDGGPELEHLLSRIRVYIALHGPTVICLIQHEDCGAYGGSSRFPSFEDEVASHTKELKVAAETISRPLPDKTVRMFIVRLSGELLPIEL